MSELKPPSSCMACNWRDAEACQECGLMLNNPFRTLEEQYIHCPYVLIAKEDSKHGET